MKTPILKYRQLWTLIADAVVTLIVFFVGKYAGLMLEDVKVVVTVLQPIVGLLIVAFTVDDYNMARLEITRLELRAGGYREDKYGNKLESALERKK